ncbi:ABC transporter permease [Clostridium sp. CF011]|uniref:FtsX-like permease family protein n=1 Tax=Clostridium sp. CF011 TaxID=2843318 RepID=UPI001C0D0E74|nr:ABC transporter permease [Clostridium sp. CF011]MBU3091023.1 ABC transporter permease [Clostridium sp. CF011]WAG69055.1 ABC transporter permease [Clostridium sp. CF011]
MYVRLAINNAKKSIKDYLIYFITITLCVSLFYAFTSMSSSSYELITEDSINLELLKQILKYSTYIVTALLVLLIGYVNKYMIKRRQNEFATYILLGTEQKSVALMFFIEMLIIGIASIILGIFIGTLFSQVVTAIVLMTAKQSINFSFKLYMDTVIITFIFFIVMFCIIGFFNMKALGKVKIIDMINAQKKTEFQFKRSKFVYVSIFIVAIVLYSVCGYCSYEILKTTVTEGDKAICIAVGLIGYIIGTYALFYSLAYIIIDVKDKWTNFKYEYTNLFLIGAIVSKIKTAPILMATISITFLGAALSFSLTLLMSQWTLGFLDYRVPYDIIINNDYSIISDRSDISKKSNLLKIDYKKIIEHLNNDDYNMDDYCQAEKYFLNVDDFKARDKRKKPMLVISLSDYNKLRKMRGYEKVTLNNNEFTMQWAKMIEDTDIENYIKENSTININSNNLKISSNSYYKESIGEGIYSGNTNALIVVPDKWCKKLILAGTDLFANTKKKISYDKALGFEKQYVPQWFEENYSKVLSEYKIRAFYPIFTNIKVAEVSEILNATLAMRILGMYLGTVLLMISLTVLALQQLSDSIEHKERFKTLKKLGIDNNEINKIILKQIALYFIMPISVAIIGFIICMYNFEGINSKVISVFIGDSAFVFNIGISLAIILIIYICYFLATYYTFKRNVKGRSKSC